MTALDAPGYGEVPDHVLFDGEPKREIPVYAPDDAIAPEVPTSFNDAHVAEALAVYLHNRWLYVAAWNRWLYWDGTRWAHDQTEQVYEQARQWVIELVATVARVGASSEDVRRAARYRDRYKLEAALTMARRVDGISAAPSDFDRHPDQLNVANGIVNLYTGELTPHDPRLRHTKLAPVDYVPGARHHDIFEVLRVVSPGIVGWLKVLLGYACTGHTSEDVVAVFDGSGANGKSTLLEAVGSVLGDYAAAVSPQLVMRTKAPEHAKRMRAYMQCGFDIFISVANHHGVVWGDGIVTHQVFEQIRFSIKTTVNFRPVHAVEIAP